MFRWAHVLLGVDLAPKSNEVVEPPEVPVLVVPLHPGGPMVDRDSRRERDCLSKVDEVYAAQVSAIIDKQQGTSNDLLIDRKEPRKGRGK